MEWVLRKPESTSAKKVKVRRGQNSPRKWAASTESEAAEKDIVAGVFALSRSD